MRILIQGNAIPSRIGECQLCRCSFQFTSLDFLAPSWMVIQDETLRCPNCGKLGRASDFEQHAKVMGKLKNLTGK